jgi:protein-S-isoprenylcysteine O-methyltransferase Ste14
MRRFSGWTADPAGNLSDGWARETNMPSERSKFLGHVRLVLLYILIGWLAWASQPTPRTFFTGLALVVFGEAVRFWAAGHLLKSRELVTSGPYAYTQNPLYLGRIFIYAGFCVMAYLPYYLNLVVLAVGTAIFSFYYIPRKIRVEGARLARLHGEAWSAYFQEMPILFPRLTRYHASVAAPWRTERMMRNREYLMVLGVGLICVLFAAKAWGWM